MKTTILIALLSLAISSTSCGQSIATDCAKNLDKTPYFVTHNVIAGDDSILTDFKILKECGQLDSIDSELINGPMLGSIMIEHATEGKAITYRSILKSINEFKQTNNYKLFRDAKMLESKVVNLSNWENDRQLLVSVGMPEPEIADFKEFIKLNSGQKMTFKQAYTAYMASKPKEQAQETAKLQFTNLGDLENAIKLGKEHKKTILIYFTCHACANARKMEDKILTNEQVKSLITDNYHYFSAYVDDNTIEAGSTSTTGSNYLKLQSEKFKTNYQPYFVLVDDKGNVVASTGYTNNPDEFVDFLKKGLK
ncbi:MAG: hypothetical protein JWO09_1589 [Bacteroidetes bacterium]|nr:hypothetical protein [Bacteroidota bacterium]